MLEIGQRRRVITLCLVSFSQAAAGGSEGRQARGDRGGDAQRKDFQI